MHCPSKNNSVCSKDIFMREKDREPLYHMLEVWVLVVCLSVLLMKSTVCHNLVQLHCKCADRFMLFATTFSHHPPSSVPTLPPLPSSTPFQPSSASADGSGFNNNNSRAWWGPSWSAHIHTVDSICLWMGRQLPIPRQLQLTEGGGHRESPKAKGGIKKNKAVLPGRQKEEDNKGTIVNMFYGLFFPLLVPDGTGNNTGNQIQPKNQPCIYTPTNKGLLAIKSRIVWDQLNKHSLNCL